MARSVFISYSHEDGSLVRPVVALLRGSTDLVFQDITGIRPGKQWKQEIETAVRTCDVLVLFWCIHASRSETVKWEYGIALSAAKDVMPLLFDSTPTPEELTPFQWVDFRELAGRGHRTNASPALRAFSRAARYMNALRTFIARHVNWDLIIAVLIALAGILTLWPAFFRRPTTQVLGGKGSQASFEGLRPFAIDILAAFAIAAFVVCAALAVVWLAGRTGLFSSLTRSSAEQRIADRLAAEFKSRGLTTQKP
jgi:TIR domain